MLGGQTTTSYIKKQASEFMDAWLGDMEELKSMYGDSAKTIDGLGNMSDQLAAEFDSYKETFTPYRDMLLEMADSDGERRNVLAEQFMTLAKPDYQGASGRAVTDAAVQSGIAREGMTRDLARSGTVSGARLEDNMRKSHLDEARMRTLASTAAQQSEKDRGMQAAGAGLNIFDPTRSITAAAGIDQGANQLLTAQSNVDVAKAGLQTNLANSYSANVTRQLGDAAGTYEGMSVTQGLKSDANRAEAWDKDRIDANRKTLNSGTYTLGTGVGTHGPLIQRSSNPFL